MAVPLPLSDELVIEALPGGDNISVTVRFRSLSERDFHRGIAWYADGEKLVGSEYNPATSYAFGMIPPEFGNLSNLLSLDLYENSLTGDIPSLGKLNSLKYLRLNENKLSGTIPTEVLDLVNTGSFIQLGAVCLLYKIYSISLSRLKFGIVLINLTGMFLTIH